MLFAETICEANPQKAIVPLVDQILAFGTYLCLPEAVLYGQRS